MSHRPEKPKWVKGVPSAEVDLERIREELMGRTMFETLLYLGYLEREEPETFRRYLERAIEENWHPGPAGLAVEGMLARLRGEDSGECYIR